MRYKNGVYIPPLDDTPVDGELEEGITSNRVFDHEGNTTTVHGVVSAATANKIIVRDASARAKVAAPSAEDDIALKSNVTTVAGDLTTHAALQTAHGAVSAATASKMVVRDAAARAKFAAAAAAGDAIVADANVRAPDSTLLEGSTKATVQDHTPKAHSIASHNDTTGTGAELEELTDGSETTLHSHAAAAAATKELFVPAHPGAVEANFGVKGDFGVIVVNSTNISCYATFKVPHDFGSITNAEFIVISHATQAAANWDIFSDYAVVGEAYTTHSESDEASTYNVTANEIYAIDISGILSGLVPDDYVGIRLKNTTGNLGFYALGVRFKYS